MLGLILLPKRERNVAMGRFKYVLVVCTAMIGMVVEAMDQGGGRPSFIGIKKRHPVAQSGSQGQETPQLGTNTGADAVPADQAELEGALLGNTDYPLPWTVAQKMTLGVGIGVFIAVLVVGGYLLYEKFHLAKQDDGLQDQQSIGQHEAGSG
jgi:hypothetical protein